MESRDTDNAIVAEHSGLSGAEPKGEGGLAGRESSGSAPVSLLSVALAGLLTAAVPACGESGKSPSDQGAGGAGLGGESAMGGATGVKDRDGDGFVAPEDCDDQNRRVYPGADERSHDDLDSDCDGEELPEMKLVWAPSGDENLVDGLKLLDEDEDGAVSLAEFAAACRKSASLTGGRRPGVVQLHVTCAGTNSCRGMVYQQWNEVYEHSCRAVNFCAGWSCVETAEDQGREPKESWEAATCGFCHTAGAEDEDGEFVADESQFKVQVPPSEDPESYVSEFWTSRSDEHLRSVVSFGLSGLNADDYAYANMPGSYQILSLREIDELLAYLRKLEPKGGEPFDELVDPSPMEE